MKITWSLPVRGERLGSSRGDLVRAASLIRALRDAGDEVDVVEDAARPGASVAVSGYRSVARRLLPRRLALILRDAGRALHARAHARRVIESARRHGSQLIIETQVHFAGSGAAAARATGLPLVLDDCSPSSEEVVLGCGLPGLARRILRDQAAVAAAMIVPSEALRRAMIAEGIPADRLRVVPNGVDLAAAGRALSRRETTRGELGLGARVALVFAGSFQPWHDAGLLAQAAAMLRGRDSLAIVLAGDGPGRASAAAAARAVPGLLTVDLGALPHERVGEILAACDVGVLPGTNDYGQPMKLLEYAAVRLPSVAPDLPPVRETITDERHGLLFPPGRADSLAAALQRLSDDPGLRLRLGESAHDEVAAPASWSRRAEEIKGSGVF